MPPTWRAKQSQRQGARAALDRPRLKVDDEPAPDSKADPFIVDYPDIGKPKHPTWWHVYRLEVTGPVLIAEVPTQNRGHLVMARERWRTRMSKWKHETFESFRPLKPGA